MSCYGMPTGTKTVKDVKQWYSMHSADGVQARKKLSITADPRFYVKLSRYEKFDLPGKRCVVANKTSSALAFRQSEMN